MLPNEAAVSGWSCEISVSMSVRVFVIAISAFYTDLSVLKIINLSSTDWSED
jgi:hypothetical protein